MEKGRKNYNNNICSSYFCEDTQCREGLFPELIFHEGIILEDPRNSHRLHLTHGHQADFLNSTGWKIARFLVRYLWKPLEHFGVADPTSAAKNYICKGRIENRLSDYAIKKQLFLIAGHTHRPRLNQEMPYYVNTGSCVHPSCITCIEIENYHLTLIKWALSTKKDRTLYVSREVLSQIPLSFNYYN